MSVTLPSATHSRADVSEIPQLVRHAKRPTWGRGALIWTRPTKRAYQFEDGRLRVFKRGFYDLLEAVDTSTLEADRLANLLQERGEAREAVKEARKEARKEAPPVDARGNLDAQIAWFRKEWPGGFRGQAWKTRHRATDGTRLKRHRDPLLEDARRLLSAGNLGERVRDGDAAGVHREIMELLERTDLVPPGQRKHLEAARVDRLWLDALYELLHGEGSQDVRFEKWVTRLRGTRADACTWPIATMPLALLRPSDHLLVRRTLLRRQVRRIRPGLVIPRNPGAPTLSRIESMTAWMTETMAEHDLVPQDHLDIYDFMRLTLQKKALEAIEAA